MTRNRLTTIIVTVTSLCMSATLATAQTKEKKIVDVPPADKLDPLTLQWAVRASVAQGVAWLTNRAAADDNGWIVPPNRTSRVVGHTNRVYRYSEQPTPLYEYENYTVYKRLPGADSQSARTLKPVTMRRVKRIIDPTGGPTRLVHDPNGPIVREVRVPIYERTGPDSWPYGRVGLNAMSLYALLKAGVSDEEPEMFNLAYGLSTFVEDFGVPDTTWDTAWLTAALSLWPDESAKKAARACASKLLDGQILDPPARGLWGPACVNVPLLAAAYIHEQNLSDLQTKAKLFAQKKSTSKPRLDAAINAENDLLHFQTDMKRIATLAMAFDQIDSFSIRLGDANSAEVIIGGLPHYIFNQNSADLESTALALFALRIASETGTLPTETWRPKMDGAVGVPPAEKTEAILARTANAIKNLQLRTGDWTESNIHQPVTAFDKMAQMIPGVPVNAGSFGKLFSAQTQLATLQGYASLANIGQIVGFERALGRFRGNFGAGLVAARKAITALPDRTSNKDVGGRAIPTEAYFFAGAACDAPGTRRREEFNSWMRMAYELASTQHTNGSWTAQANSWLFPTSFKARMDALPKLDRSKPAQIMDRSAAHVRANWTNPGSVNAYYAPDRQVIMTAQALLSLTSGAHPMFLSASLSDKPINSTMPDVVLRELSASTKVDWLYARADLTKDDLLLDISAPAMFLNGTADKLSDPDTRKRLSEYVRSGGIVIAFANTISDAELSLIKALPDLMIASCEEQGQLRNIAEDNALLGELAGRLRRPLNAVIRGNGRLAALFLQLAERGIPNESVFTPSEAAKIITVVLERSLDSSLLSPAYAHKLDDLGNPLELLQTSLQLLKAPPQKLEPPPPADPPPAAATPPAKQTTPAPKAAVTPRPPSPPPPPPTPRPPAADEVW
ncbi:MAG: hypothetical protein GX230_06670 [Lentisphaerae bacterium]|nr:hypothetical protein [Lentisphaerota bacterium]